MDCTYVFFFDLKNIFMLKAVQLENTKEKRDFYQKKRQAKKFMF